MATPKLTILLALKGRYLHTLRFLWHANQERMPYRFLIADGQVHPALSRLLENAEVTFPNLEIEYMKYPDDVDLAHYFNKVADAADRVATPYVMQPDNDDFLMQSGIERCIAFLDTNRTYASCGAGVAGFSLSCTDGPLNQVTGPIDRLRFRYYDNPQYLPCDFSSRTVIERIRDRFLGTYAIYYNVFKSDSMATIWRDVADLNFSDLELQETYFGMRAKSLGHSRLDGMGLSYLRQEGTSMNAAMRADWVAHLLRSRFTSDFESMVRRMSRIIADADETDPEAAAEEIRKLYAERLKADLRARFGAPWVPRRRYHPIAMAKACLQWMSLDGVVPAYRNAVARRRNSPARLRAALNRGRQAIMEQLRSYATPEAEIGVIRDELVRIERLLEGHEFEDWVRRHASDLIADAARPLMASAAL